MKGYRNINKISYEEEKMTKIIDRKFGYFWDS